MGKIKEILVIEKFDNTKILIDADDKLPNDITLRNVLILITCIIKDDNKYIRNYSQKKHCLLNKYGIQQDAETVACQKIRQKEQNQFLLVKIRIQLRSGKELAKLGQGGVKSWQKWYKCFQGVLAIYDLDVSKLFGTCENLLQFKKLCEFCQFFLYEDLSPKCFDTKFVNLTKMHNVYNIYIMEISEYFGTENYA